MKESIRSQLRKKIFSEKAKGEVITSSDFLAFWPRTAVDQALSRMARDGELKRILPGIYEIPATNKRFNLPVPTDPEQVAKAWARKNEARLLPNGIYAANALWLSDQMAGRYEYLTDRPSATVRVGGWKLLFKKTSPKLMRLSGSITGLVVQALRSLGRESIDRDFVVSQLTRRLSDTEKEQLSRDMELVPVWMRPILQQVITPPVSHE